MHSLCVRQKRILLSQYVKRINSLIAVGNSGDEITRHNEIIVALPSDPLPIRASAWHQCREKNTRTDTAHVVA